MTFKLTCKHQHWLKAYKKNQLKKAFFKMWRMHNNFIHRKITISIYGLRLRVCVCEYTVKKA